jgi:hypothetical protein
MSEKPLHKPAGIVSKLIELAPDKLIELALSVLFSTALVGGGYYLLFQFPAEHIAIERENTRIA